MERSAPMRKPSSSMAGLLKWMEGPPPDPEALASRRLHQVRLASRGECGVCFAVADSDPKEPASLAEAAKEQELSGSLQKNKLKKKSFDDTMN